MWPWNVGPPFGMNVGLPCASGGPASPSVSVSWPSNVEVNQSPVPLAMKCITPLPTALLCTALPGPAQPAGMASSSVEMCTVWVNAPEAFAGTTPRHMATADAANRTRTLFMYHPPRGEPDLGRDYGSRMSVGTIPQQEEISYGRDCLGQTALWIPTQKHWRRRPESNWGWRFCRPLPCHLATSPRPSSPGFYLRCRSPQIGGQLP